MISNFYWIAWVWCATNGVTLTPPDQQWRWRSTDGVTYSLVKWDVEGVPKPTDAQLLPLQAEADRLANIEHSMEVDSIVLALQNLRPACTNAIAEAKLIDDNKTRKAAVDTAQAINELRKTILLYMRNKENE